MVQLRRLVERVQATCGALLGFRKVRTLQRYRNASLSPRLICPFDRLVLLEKYSPFGVTTGGHLTVALGGLALLLLAAGLWRRKRTSWLLTLAILIISIPAHLIKGLDYEEAILASLLAGWLLTLRAHFHTRSDAPSVRQGLLAILIAFAFTFLYGIAGFYLLDHHFKVNFGFWAAARQTVNGT